ncbi:MAG TPA: hypothetical protein VHL58_12265, partial [Thermoanaerobaculia bacterium]|nr:hypothetical protein [Thermoanaerobaculia bacterium]
GGISDFEFRISNLKAKEAGCLSCCLFFAFKFEIRNPKSEIRNCVQFGAPVQASVAIRCNPPPVIRR